jgi:SpoIVB peptidase S55
MSRTPGFWSRRCGWGRVALRAFALLAALVMLTGLARAGEKAAAMKLSVPIMKTSELKPGMKGYGLSVFKGTKPEKFEVEIVDVLKRAFPKHDMILIKCKHPVIEKAHIIAGMSGSPIYINNKLIGALAYGWSFTKEPIAGVTPIEWMLEELAEPKPQARKERARIPAKAPALAGGAKPRLAGLEVASGPAARRFEGIKQLALPMCASGMVGLPARALKKIRARFARRGLQLAEGGSGAGGRKVSVDKLVPGGAIGVSLMRGDVSLTGIGTVTHREGNRLIAFGHPMMLTGQEVAYPITTAYIHGVLPSQWSSFKFGSPAQSVGLLTQDRMPAIAGTLGKKCPMIEVSASITNPTNGKSQTLKVQMIRSRNWSPMLMWYVCSRLLLLEGVADSSFAVDYKLDMEFEKHGKLHLEGMDMAYWGFMISEPEYALSALMNNSFEVMKPTKINLKLKAIHKRIDARIQRVWLEQLEVQPGKEVKLHMQINPYGGKPREIVFPIKVPPHLDEGKYDLVVAGGNSWAVAQPTPPADSVKDIFTQLKRRYRPTTAVAVLKLPSVGVGFKGKLYRQLPSSVFGTLVSSSSAGLSTFQDGIHFTQETKWYLTGGSQRLKIIVKQSAEEGK